jgi:hypothetical protein
MKRVLNLIGMMAMLCVLSPAGSSGSTLGESYILFGLNEYGYAYSEDDPPYPDETGTPKSDEYGLTSAFHAEGKFFSKTSVLYGGFLFEYGGGIQTYNGSTDSIGGYDSIGNPINIISPLVNLKSSTFTRIGGFIGPYFKFGDCLLGLNAGVLYYRWYRGLGDSSLYSETYSWYYLPIGAELSYNLNDRMSVGLDLQYRIMLNGTMQASYDAVNLAGYPTAVSQFSLGPMDGFYFGIPVRFQIDNHFGIECKPWFEWRPSGSSSPVVVQSADSSLQGGAQEPESSSYSIGISISAMFGNF